MLPFPNFVLSEICQTRFWACRGKNKALRKQEQSVRADCCFLFPVLPQQSCFCLGSCVSLSQMKSQFQLTHFKILQHSLNVTGQSVPLHQWLDKIIELCSVICTILHFWNQNSCYLIWCWSLLMCSLSSIALLMNIHRTWYYFSFFKCIQKRKLESVLRQTWISSVICFNLAQFMVLLCIWWND